MSCFVNYRPAFASEEEYVSKNSSTPKLPNSFNRDGENVGPAMEAGREMAAKYAYLESPLIVP